VNPATAALFGLPVYVGVDWASSRGMAHDDFAAALAYSWRQPYWSPEWICHTLKNGNTISVYDERSPMTLRRTESLSDDFIVLASDDDRLVRHDSSFIALTEAQRLAKANPGTNFKVFCEVNSAKVPKPLPTYPRYFERINIKLGGSRLLCYLTKTTMQEFAIIPSTLGQNGRYEWSDIRCGGVDGVSRDAFREISHTEALALAVKLGSFFLPTYPRYFIRLKDDQIFTIQQNPVCVYHTSSSAQTLVERGGANVGYEWSPLAGGDVERVLPDYFREVTAKEALGHARDFAWGRQLPSFAGVTA
jgi:hypothetical protein